LHDTLFGAFQIRIYIVGTAWRGVGVELSMIFGLAFVGAAWCAAATPVPLVSGTPEPVVLQLKWKHQFQFAGYVVARERGYYREAGLDVTIVEAAADRHPVTEVLEGRAQYGVGTTELLLDRATGRNLVVLAVIFQHSPLALAVRSDRVQNVHQLSGKRVIMEPGSAELVALLKREGLLDTGVPPQFLSPSFEPHDFIEGEVDAMSVYQTDEPFLLDAAHAPYQLLSARTAGVDFYGDNLFTTQEELLNHPERVAAFRAASLRGWHEAMAHPEAAVDLILAHYSKRKSREHLLYEAQRSRELIKPEAVEIGYMYPGRWQHIANTYAEVGMLAPETSLDGFLYQPQAPWQVPDWWRWVGAVLVLMVVAALTLAVAVARTGGRAERRLRLVLDHAPTPMLVTDVEFGVVLYANRRATAFFGWTRDDRASLTVQSSCVDLSERDALLDVLRQRGGVVDQEVTLRRADGQPAHVLLSASVSTYAGRPALIAGFVDVSGATSG